MGLNLRFIRIHSTTENSSASTAYDTFSAANPLLFRRFFPLSFALTAALSCAHEAPPVVVRPPPVIKKTFRAPSPPEWTFWEPVEPVITAEFQPGPFLPLSEADLPKKDDPSAPLLAEEERTKLQRQGFVVVAGKGEMGVGSYYASFHREHVPHVITFDALFLIAHAALRGAFAESDASFARTSMDAVVRDLLSHIEKDLETSPSDVRAALLLVRGILCTALAFSDPAYVVPQEHTNAVQQELAFARAHDGVHESPILGAPIDYAVFGGRDVSLPSSLHAFLWLTRAPLFLAADTEAVGSPLKVAKARTHARAALLLSHYLARTPTEGPTQQWRALQKLNAFEWGDADDLLADSFADLAESASLDFKSLDAIADVAKVDRVRHAALDAHSTELFDGAGAKLRTRPIAGTFGPSRGALSVRFLGAGAPLDSEVFQSLVFPMVGKTVIDPPPAAARKGYRVFPSALDLGAWLGSAEARDVLRQIGADAFEGFDAAFEKVSRRRPQENTAALHRSIHMSLLDAIDRYLSPSLAEPEALKSEEWRTRKLESALSAWTLLRHVHRPFERLPFVPENESGAVEEDDTATPTFIEPHPEAIAKLAATLKQAEKGVIALAHLDPKSPAVSVLREAESILFVAYRAALRWANGELLSPEERADVNRLDERIRRFERRCGRGAIDSRNLVAVHRELGTNSTLFEATGSLETLVMAMRDPASTTTVLVRGAHLPHYEFVTGAARAPTDTSFRDQIAAGEVPKRDPYVSTYRTDPTLR